MVAASAAPTFIRSPQKRLLFAHHQVSLPQAGAPGDQLAQLYVVLALDGRRRPRAEAATLERVGADDGPGGVLTQRPAHFNAQKQSDAGVGLPLHVETQARTFLRVFAQEILVGI